MVTADPRLVCVKSGRKESDCFSCYRCVRKFGLWKSLLKRGSNSGNLVSRPGLSTHKLQGALRGLHGRAGLHAGGGLHGGVARQQVCCLLREQDGWNKIFLFESARKGSLAARTAKERLADCKVAAKTAQPDGGSAVENPPQCLGNLGGSGDTDVPVESLVQTNNRLICEQKVSRDTPLLQFEERSLLSRGQFQPQGVARQSLCFSSDSGDSDGCEQDLEVPSKLADSYCSKMAGGPLVGTDISDATSRADSSVSRLIVPDGGSETSSPVSLSGLPGVRGPGPTLSDAARHLMDADIRKSTKKVYDARFAIFQQYCANIGCDPFSCETTHILNFLAMKYEDGGSYQTVNGFRSAISKYHVGINSTQVGNLPSVRRLVKGVFQENPPLPRYSKFWDVSQLLEFLKTLHPPSSLSIQCLGQKTLALLSLCSVCRVSSVSQLSTEYNIIREEKGDVSHIVLYLCGLEKTSRPGHIRKEIKVPIYVAGYEEDSLNLYIYFKAYLEATSDRRDLSPPNSKGIFISNTQVSALATSLTLADSFVSAVPASKTLDLVKMAPPNVGPGGCRHLRLQGTQLQGRGLVRHVSERVFIGSNPGAG